MSDCEPHLVCKCSSDKMIPVGVAVAIDCLSHGILLFAIAKFLYPILFILYSRNFVLMSV